MINIKKGLAALAIAGVSALAFSGCNAATIAEDVIPTDPHGPLDGPVEEWEAEQYPAPPSVIEVPAGQTFDYTKVYSDGSATVDWKVQLTKVECGLDRIPKGADNPKWQGGDDVPQHVTAKAASGKQFCIAHWDWTNVGKTPGYTDDAGDIVIGDERYTREDEISETIEETHLTAEESGRYDETNPHDKVKSLDVYVVPAGATAEAVWFPMATFDGDSSYLVKAK